MAYASFNSGRATPNRRPTMTTTRRAAPQSTRRASTSAYRTAPSGSYKVPSRNAIKTAPQGSFKTAPSNVYKTTPVGSKMFNPLKAKQDALKTAPKGSFKTAPEGSFTTAPIGSKMMAPKSAMKIAPTGGAVKGIPTNMKVSFKNSPIMQELAGRNKKQSISRPTSGYQKQQTVDAPPPKRTVLMDTDTSKVTPPTVAERIRTKIEDSKEAGGFKVGGNTTIGPISNPIDKQIAQENQRGPSRRKGKYGRGGVNFRF